MFSELVVLITGAAGRLGGALAQRLAVEGAHLVLVDVDSNRLENLIEVLPACQVLGFVANSGVASEMENVLVKAKKHFKSVDAAVHAAYPRSNAWGTKFEKVDRKFLNEDLSNQLGGAIIMSQQLINFFEKQGHGNLILISSIMGITSPRFDSYTGTEMSSPVEYTAIKAGIIAVTKYLAKYCSNKGIRVNCMSPGGIVDEQPEIFLKKYKSFCNQKGMLDPEDLTGAILFLLSDQSTYISGQNLVVDDGWSL